VILVVTTPLTVHCGAPDVTKAVQPIGKVSSSTINSVLRVVDNNRTNTKLTNKNNIINGTSNNTNYSTANIYQTNLTAQQQFNNANNLKELNNNLNSKQQQEQNTSLSALFSQFTELIKFDELKNQNENLNSSKSSAVLLNLACDFASKDQKAKWEAILYNNNLYLQIPAGVLIETSKEAFVNLLEYAEEELKCQNVVICLDKKCAEKSNNLIRMFMYFGFFSLPPSHPLTPKNASDSLLFMAYSFE